MICHNSSIIKLPKIKNIYKDVGFRNIGGANLVQSECRLSVHRAIYQLALYFKREFHYDFVQYSYDGIEDNETCKPYIWFDYSFVYSIIYGACCFRLRTDESGKSYWALQWIWFHPYMRNRGILSKAWPYFEHLYGIDFFVEPPISHAMNAFLKNRHFAEHTSL